MNDFSKISPRFQGTFENKYSYTFVYEYDPYDVKYVLKMLAQCIMFMYLLFSKSVTSIKVPSEIDNHHNIFPD